MSFLKNPLVQTGIVSFLTVLIDRMTNASGWVLGLFNIPVKG